MQRALIGGILAAAICAVAGTWVIVRGLAFLGEALSHGMLPGVAIAGLLGWPPMVGAAASAAVMGAGVSALSRRGRLSGDTAIGLLFAGMLALGVIIVSHSQSFATDLTAILFGDVLAIRMADLVALAGGVIVTVALAAIGHRAFLALSVDDRIAGTLGLAPRWAEAGLIALVAVAVVSAAQAVGTLLVVALLLGPAAAARRRARSVTATMAGAAVIGTASVVVGLLVSWQAGTAAGASIAIVAVGAYPIALILTPRRSRAAAVGPVARLPIPEGTT
ncbi:metal ABC transporter permease [Mycetocola reblochoni]|nr:metal ABC transporter permease [Mycetocola reblochoni]